MAIYGPDFRNSLSRGLNAPSWQGCTFISHIRAPVMLEFFTKYRLHIAVGLALLAAFIFYSLNLKGKERPNPFEKGVLTISTPLFRAVAAGNGAVGAIWADYIDLVNVRKENKELRDSVKILNSRLMECREAVLANERMKGMLAMSSAIRLPSLAASVIAEDSSPWFKTLVIDRGKGNGLADGMPVVAASGVVGQLVKVAWNSSRVLLLTDHASAVSAIIQRSRARGVVKGKGGGLCTLEFTIKDEDVKVGDIVISSGIGGKFPKGLPIGEVAMVKKGEYGIFQTIEVRPAVNLSRLEEVLVLLEKNNDQ